MTLNNGHHCSCCSEPLYFNNEHVLAINERTEIKRWMCCGKGMHGSCWAKNQSLEDQLQGRCPLCTAHTGSFQKTGKIVTSLKKWVKKKKTWAVTDLALMTYCGQGVPKNEKRAVKMLEKAIALGDANAMHILGGLFYRKLSHGKELEPKQQQQMVELLKRGASLNHPAALADLGSMHWNGWGVDQCNDKGIEYNGWGVDQCNDKGIEYTTRAAQLNNHAAIGDLKFINVCLFVNRTMNTIKSIPKKMIKATISTAAAAAATAAATTIRIHADCNTWNKAVEVDSVHQDRSLATPLPIEPDEPCFACSQTLPKDHCKTMRFMCCGRAMHYPCLNNHFKDKTKAYFNTHDPMCPCCNTMYPTLGTDEEWAVLEEWTKTHKELSWPYCIMAFRIKAGYFKHASFYSQSLIKDNYEKAALLGNVVGMVNLGTLYGNGSHGVGQDLVKARQWWGQAAALNDETAMCCLDLLNKRDASDASLGFAKQPPPPVIVEENMQKSTHDLKNKIKPNAGRVDYCLDVFFDWGFKCLILLVMYWSVGVLWNLLQVHVVAGPLLFEILPKILMVLFFLSFEILVVCFFLVAIFSLL